MLKRLSLAILIIALSIFAPCPSALNSEEKITVVVFDLEGSLPPDELQTLSEALRTTFFESGKYTIVNRQQMQKIMEELRFSQSGVADQNKASQVGKALGAKKAIYGRIGSLDNSYQISLTLVDIETTQEEKRINKTVRLKSKINLSLQLAGYELVGMTASKDDMAQLVSSILLKRGYGNKVQIKDVQGADTSNYVIHMTNVPKGKKTLDVLLSVSDAIGTVKDVPLSWKVSNIYVVGSEIWYAPVSGVNTCYESAVTKTASGEEILNCVKAIWKKEQKQSLANSPVIPPPASIATPPEAHRRTFPASNVNSTIKLSVIDNCNDNMPVQYRFYDQTNRLVYPPAEKVFITRGFGVKFNSTLNCKTGAKICYGAASGQKYWGVGIENKSSCSDCCIKCVEGFEKVVNFTCN